MLHLKDGKVSTAYVGRSQLYIWTMTFWHVHG